MLVLERVLVNTLSCGSTGYEHSHSHSHGTQPIEESPKDTI